MPETLKLSAAIPSCICLRTFRCGSYFQIFVSINGCARFAQIVSLRDLGAFDPGLARSIFSQMPGYKPWSHCLGTHDNCSRRASPAVPNNPDTSLLLTILMSISSQSVFSGHLITPTQLGWERHAATHRSPLPGQRTVPAGEYLPLVS